MQITINQSEIESAITTYIGGLFKLNPGTKVQIELKATRGAEGATAIIDIVPDVLHSEPIVRSTPIQQPAAVQEPKKEKAEVINDIKATSAKLFAAPVVAEVPAVVTVDEGTAAIATPSLDQAWETAKAEATEQAEVPVPARTSLFAGLKKPVNA